MPGTLRCSSRNGAVPYRVAAPRAAPRAGRGLIIATLGLLADLIVRSRSDG